MHIDCAVGFADCSQTKVVGPTDQHPIELLYKYLWSLPSGTPPVSLLIARHLPQRAIAPRSPAHQQLAQTALAQTQLHRGLLLGYVPFTNFVQNLEPVPLLCRHPQSLCRFRHAPYKREKRNFLYC
jgi:hypothetical protein